MQALHSDTAEGVESVDIASRAETRVLIVNDSSVTASVIEAILHAASGYRVVAAAVNGQEAIRMVDQYSPDIVIMDIHMPVMGGVEATQKIMSKHPRCRILIASATLQSNMKRIFSALQCGAVDYVHSPHLACSPGTAVKPVELQRAGRELLRKMENILLIDGKKLERVYGPEGATTERGARSQVQLKRVEHPMQYLVIGASTGGTRVIANLLSALIHPFPVPILICQHINENATDGFVSWLSDEIGMKVEVAKNLMAPVSGKIYVAPGGRQNLEFTRSGNLQLVSAQPKQWHTPNIDHLFSSMADNIDGAGCAVVLSGLGKDGAAGIAQVSRAGGSCFTQSLESALVESMPRAAQQALGGARGYSVDVLSAAINQLFTARSAQ